MTKYFFIDYDNTLFSHWTRRIPDSAVEALRQLHRAGHKFILSSGRGFHGDLSNDFATDIMPDGVIGANGAILKAEGKIIKETYYNPEVQNRVIDFVMERGYCLMSHYQDQGYVSNLERMKERRRNFPLREMPLGGDAFLTLRDKPIFSFFMDDDEDALRDLERHFPEVKVLRMGNNGGADVVPRENGKALGMKQILDYFGSSLEASVAIGDSMNDIEMIETAALGIAMGNAMQEVRDAADYVAKHIEEDGFLDAVQYALSWDGA